MKQELILLVNKSDGKKITIPIFDVESVTILRRVDGKGKPIPISTTTCDGTISPAKTTEDWAIGFNKTSGQMIKNDMRCPCCDAIGDVLRWLKIDGKEITNYRCPDCGMWYEESKSL